MFFLERTFLRTADLTTLCLTGVSGQPLKAHSIKFSQNVSRSFDVENPVTQPIKRRPSRVTQKVRQKPALRVKPVFMPSMPRNFLRIKLFEFLKTVFLSPVLMEEEIVAQHVIRKGYSNRRSPSRTMSCAVERELPFCAGNP